MTTFNEANTIEEAIRDRLCGLQTNVGLQAKEPSPTYGDFKGQWQFVHGTELPHKEQDTLIESWLKAALCRLNPDIAKEPEKADEVIYKLRGVLMEASHSGLVRANELFTEWLRGEKSMPLGKDGEISRFTLQKGDVVITKDSEDPYDIAIPSFIFEDIDNLVCGYHLVILRPKNNLIDGRFLFHLLNSYWARHRFYPYAQGTTRYGIVSDAYDKIKVPLPSIEKQVVYADALDSLNHQHEIIHDRDGVYSSMQREIIDKELFGGTA